MSEARAAAEVMKSGLKRLRDEIGIWLEKATTLSLGRAKTTGYKSGDVESVEAWPLLDALSSIAVNDQVALVSIAGKPTVIGKIVRGAVGMARIRRHLALTGPAASFTFPGGHGAGSGATAVNCDGNDNAGFIEITTGTGTAAGVFLRISFSENRENTKYNLILIPRSNSARSLGGVFGPTNHNVGSVDIDSRTALTASTLYQWGYEIKGFE